VLAVDGFPLTAAEVEPLARDILELYPEYTPVHARRLALTNEFLPRLATRALQPEPWELARQACEAAGAELDRLTARSDEGNFTYLGLAVWSAARHLPLGQWSEPVELIGRWARVRLDVRDVQADARAETLRVSMLEFPWLDPAQARTAVEFAIDHAHLVVVDPAWNEVVPEAWKHRMSGSKP
jgi:hypothetical protein